MNAKPKLTPLISQYEEIVVEQGGQISSEDILNHLRPSIRKFLSESEEFNIWATFKAIEEKVFKSESLLPSGGSQKEFPFSLNLQAIVPLGDSMRICYGYCNREQLEMRRIFIGLQS